MDDSFSGLPFAVVATAALAFGGMAVILTAIEVATWRIRRALLRAPTLRVGDLDRADLPPLCRVSGVLSPGPAGVVTAPASRRDVIASWTILYQKHSDTDEGQAREVLWNSGPPPPMRLRDGDDSVEVDPILVFTGVPSPDQLLLEEDPRIKAVTETTIPPGGFRKPEPVTVETAKPYLAELLTRGIVTPSLVAHTETATRYILVEDVLPTDVMVHLLAVPRRAGSRTVLDRFASVAGTAWRCPPAEVETIFAFRRRSLVLPLAYAVAAMAAGIAAWHLW